MEEAVDELVDSGMERGDDGDPVLPRIAPGDQAGREGVVGMDETQFQAMKLLEERPVDPWKPDPVGIAKEQGHRTVPKDREIAPDLGASLRSGDIGDHGITLAEALIEPSGIIPYDEGDAVHERRERVVELSDGVSHGCPLQCP